MLSLDIRISVKVSDMKWIFCAQHDRIQNSISLSISETESSHRHSLPFATLTNAFAWEYMFTFHCVIIVNQIEIAKCFFHDCMRACQYCCKIRENSYRRFFAFIILRLGWAMVRVTIFYSTRLGSLLVILFFY